jgi:hypothetical protein
MHAVPEPDRLAAAPRCLGGSLGGQQGGQRYFWVDYHGIAGDCRFVVNPHLKAVPEKGVHNPNQSCGE